MNDKTVLKPCPFCGGNKIDDRYVRTYSLDSSYNLFGCEDCGAGFVDGSAKEWNTRIQPAASDAAPTIRNPLMVASEAGAMPDGCILVRQEDTEHYVHPQYGPGIFFTEDCILPAPPSAPAAEPPHTIETIWRPAGADTWRRSIQPVDAAAESAEPVGFVRMPLIPNAEMIRVLEQDEWLWQDLLAAAAAITESQYAEITAATADAQGDERAQGWTLPALLAHILDNAECEGGHQSLLDDLRAAVTLSRQPSAPASAVKLSDDECLAVYVYLDEFGRNIDHHEYGLPVLDDDSDRKTEALKTIRAALAAAKPGDTE